MSAVAARVHFIVAYDSDLLALGKSYVIAYVTPGEFLSLVRRSRSAV